ncbi:phosphonate metabolism transcriptional regulator PhnF [Ahrensia marina]|uniref:Transcriptional regulator n=1 Tax=Ahrensia marina TaxID=1514904 RepID=A0A0M9GPV6_9HYPH|nr:phosphonate metabolism transcriptional regulator PhnF [Ahrensia marina]KPB02609.1 transcriptional regulator [Ahrensia marina]
MISKTLERRSGIAIWRQIADELRNEIATNVSVQNNRLPSETTLAKRFEVNRHTVRAALNALAKEGIVESRQGQGTFVRARKRISYPIGKRTRFSDGIGNQVQTTRGRLLNLSIDQATPEIASALYITPSSKVICLKTLSDADDMPLSRSTSWFCAKRFPDIGTAYQTTGSITKALTQCGIADYLRQSTEIEAHHATMADTEYLQLSPGAIVLVTQAINSDMEGNPIQFSTTRFAADRVSLAIINA